MEDILYLLVGTYTTGDSKGIYIYRFNLHTGESEYVDMAKIDNPSYITACKNSKYIYAISENNGQLSYVNALLFDRTKERLSLLNRQSILGEGPCFIAIDCHREYALTANYGDGSISIFEINTYGTLHHAFQILKFEGSSINPERQKQSHIHCVKFSPDHKYIFATDLGTDSIYRFKVNEDNVKGKYIIEESKKKFKIPAGSGPRHFLFHPSGRYLYLINELSGTVIGFNYNNGDLEPFQTIEADIFHAGGSADIRICPNGHFLYVSNRLKEDGITIFYIDHLSGRLTKIGYQHTGIHPRNLAISPNGNFLLAACRDSNKVEVYKIDQNTGLLVHINKDIEVSMPVCAKFL